MTDVTPVQAMDEVFDAAGNLLSQKPRQMVDKVPSDVDLQAIRRQLRLVIRADATPAWGKVLARALLMYTWVDNDPTAGV